MTPLTPEQKLVVAKMVPEHIEIVDKCGSEPLFYRRYEHSGYQVSTLLRDWEWFYVLHLAERKLSGIDSLKYIRELKVVIHNNKTNIPSDSFCLVCATNFQRARALMKVWPQ